MYATPPPDDDRSFIQLTCKLANYANINIAQLKMTLRKPSQTISDHKSIVYKDKRC